MREWITVHSQSEFPIPQWVMWRIRKTGSLLSFWPFALSKNHLRKSLTKVSVSWFLSWLAYRLDYCHWDTSILALLSVRLAVAAQNPHSIRLCFEMSGPIYSFSMSTRPSEQNMERPRTCLITMPERNDVDPWNPLHPLLGVIIPGLS